MVKSMDEEDSKSYMLQSQEFDYKSDALSFVMKLTKDIESQSYS